MRTLTSNLVRASAARDWDCLAGLDLEVAALLRASNTRDESELRLNLQRAHAAALEDCQKEVARVRNLLRDMSERRDGVLAYALDAGGESR